MKESELVSVFNGYLSYHGLSYSNEIRMGIGIPDISVNIGGKRKVELIDDYYLLSVLDFITDNKQTSLHDIESKLVLSSKRAKQYVKKLAELGYVVTCNNSVKVARQIKKNQMGITISIEAKISDWRNGLLQAERYLLFSDYSYLLMPSNRIGNIDTDYAIKRGIGIISQEGKSIEVQVPARISNECISNLKYMHASIILNRFDESYSFRKKRNNNIFSYLLNE